MKNVSVILFFLIISSIQVVAQDSLQVKIVVKGENLTLNLYKANVRSTNYKVYTWENNTYSEITPLPESRTYRGTIVELPNALVFASINPSGLLRAKCVDMEAGHGYLWETSEDISSQIISNTTILPPKRPSQQLGQPKSGTTGTPEVGIKVSTEISDNGVPYGKLMDFKLGMDITSASYSELNGDVANILAVYELEALIYDMMLTRDAFMRVSLPSIVIRKSQFYPNPSEPRLSEIKTAWTASPLQDLGWDMVWASKGWYADLGGPFSAGAMHHEQGHSWGAQHLVYMSDIMGGNKPNHGPITVEIVQNTRKRLIDNGTLQEGRPYDFSLHPHTHVDVARVLKNSSINIDVLANDWDSNGDELSVGQFTGTTVNGGTVTLIGNSILKYTPAFNFVGKDMIAYTAVDDSELQLKTRDLVHIEVVNEDLLVYYDFEQTSGSVLTDQSGNNINGVLNGSNLSKDLIPSPLGTGIRVYGFEDENQIENAEWSGVLVGNKIVNPEPLTDDRHRSPFEYEFNIHGGHGDIMNGDYTFSTWFKFDDYDSKDWNSWGHYIASKWWHMETRVGWDLAAIDGKLTLHWREFDGYQNINTLTAPVDLEESAWYHASVVFNRTDNTIKIYLNGEVVATRTDAFNSNAYIFNGRAPLALGAFSDGQGYLDDTRIYTRALSNDEIENFFKMPGDSVRFLTDTLKVNHEIDKVYKNNLESIVWNNGNYNLSFSTENLPSWLSLSTDGVLIGNPSFSDVGNYIFPIYLKNEEITVGKVIIDFKVNNAGLNLDYWLDLNGTNLSALTGLTTYPSEPDVRNVLDSLDFPINFKNNYGARAYGYLAPKESGNYTFKISGDDECELWLSTNESTENLNKIAYSSSWTSYKNFNSSPTQISASIPLEAGKKYFIEARLKEGSGGDHLTVVWNGPGFADQIISSDYLERPFKEPTISSVTFSLDTINLGSIKYDQQLSSRISDLIQSDKGTKLRFLELDAPSWINVSQRGLVTGIPKKSDIGSYNFKVVGYDELWGKDTVVIALKVNGDLIAHWNFNDSSATSISDITGNGWDAIVSGNVNFVSGMHDGAFDFNASGSSGVLNKIPEVQGDWTIISILKRRDVSSDAHLVTGTNHSLRVEQYYNTNKLGLTINGVRDWVIEHSLPIDEWKQVVFTKKGDSIYVYADTVLFGTINYDLTLNVVEIGKNLNGVLDDLKFYGKSLNEFEILEAYNSFFNPNVSQDTQAPVLALTSPYTVRIPESGTFVLEASSLDNGSTDNVGITELSLSKSSFTCADLGTNTVTVTAKDASGNTSTAEVTVVVVDEVKPTLKAKSTYTIKLDVAGKATLKWEDIDESSTDNCSIKSRSLSKTDFTRANAGDNKVTYTITDASGNTSSIETTVRVDIVLSAPERANQGNSIKAYPNPANEYLYLEFAEGISTSAIRGSSLVDASGRVLGEIQLEEGGNGQLGFSTQELKAGMYFLRLSTRDTLHLIKFTVIH